VRFVVIVTPLSTSFWRHLAARVLHASSVASGDSRVAVSVSVHGRNSPETTALRTFFSGRRSLDVATSASDHMRGFDGRSSSRDLATGNGSWRWSDCTRAGGSEKAESGADFVTSPTGEDASEWAVVSPAKTNTPVSK